jgi:predicted metal-binding membrane protein
MVWSAPPDLASRVLRHERLIVFGGIALLLGLCWWFLAGQTSLAPGADMAMMPPSLGALVAMWWLMMLAMMLPSATPAILLYARVRRQRGEGGMIVRPWIFGAGYALVWLGFSILAAIVQQLIATPQMTVAEEWLASAVIVAAGIYQLSPVKNACLRRCRSPVQFLTRHWRPGAPGALRLGALHGAHCVGCCSMLMALLFVGGVMNFAWIALLTLIVGVEKLVPGGEWIGRAAGVALIGWAGVRLLA